VNVVDSSAWLEYFADGPNAAFFAPAITATDSLLVPSVVIYEVFKRVLQQRGEGDALRAVALLHEGRVVDFDGPLALAAGALSASAGLPMADSIILATARAYQASLYTLDADFKDLHDMELMQRA